MKYLSIEPLSGAAGDMILASLLDLGADQQLIVESLKSAGLLDFELQFTRKCCPHGIVCGYLEVLTEENKPGHHVHDHEHGHPHGHGHSHDHDHPQEHEHGHPHEHEHEHGHSHGHDHPQEHEHGSAEPEGHCQQVLPPSGERAHSHRNLAEILALIDRSTAPERAKKRAEKIFHRLAVAEAAVHGLSPSEVHFHEVGAVDSIVDIFGTCLALESLEVEKVFCPMHKIGYGTVRCAHGVMPVPAPATAKLLEGFPVTRLPIQSELTTPTGAAILTALAEGQFCLEEHRIVASGYGHGRKEFPELPNMLRAILLEVPAKQEKSTWGNEKIAILECEIDDQAGEGFGFLQEQLLAAGALDVCFWAAQMKKNRPGVHLQILCAVEQAEALAELVLTQSSSIGLRIRESDRLVLPRAACELMTPWGPVQAKKIIRPDGKVEIQAEFESMRELARKLGVPLRQLLAQSSQWE